MQIFVVDLTKQRLASMPAEERRALLLLGHAVNEINVLQKLMIMGRTAPTPHKIVDRTEAGQFLILMRILIGKLHEAWELFKQRVQADAQLRAKYLADPSADLRALIEKLNRHFGSRSALSAIRNQLSFHYVDKANLLEENFQHLSESEAWEFYLSETVANTFYYASELVVATGAIRLASPNGERKAEDFDLLFNQMKNVAANITELFQLLIADMVEAIDDDIEAVGVEIGEVAKMSLSSLPFFFDEDDLRGSREPQKA